VVEQLRVAAGERLTLRQEDIRPRGHAIECRINAEDALRDFAPTPGRVTGYHEPGGPGVRVDSSLAGPGTVAPYYDPMIAKLIVWGADRDESVRRMRRALQEFAVTGIATNIPYHLAILDHADFVAGRLSTHFIPDHPELRDRCAEWTERKTVIDRRVRDNAHIAAIGAAVAVTL
jgi:pyruvate carboxylase subunit A